MEPNDFLRQQAPGLEAGHAQCLAEAEARNAVDLAPVAALLIELEELRSELEGLEQQHWIAEEPYHRGASAAAQALGRKTLARAPSTTRALGLYAAMVIKVFN